MDGEKRKSLRKASFQKSPKKSGPISTVYHLIQKSAHVALYLVDEDAIICLLFVVKDSIVACLLNQVDAVIKWIQISLLNIVLSWLVLNYMIDI